MRSPVGRDECDREHNVGVRHQQIMVKMIVFVSPCPGPLGAEAIANIM
ncbi:MAG: hypothetical protein AB4352_20155 [Hormoscilla sp.]